MAGDQTVPMASSIDISVIREAQRAQGPATILAIGTATPSNCINQADYPDYYFRITKSEHMVDLKEKFKRMCTYYFTLTYLSFISFQRRRSCGWFC